MSTSASSKQPWLKFYPVDWRADPAVRVCSIAARGLWIEMLCLMHDAEPRGSLVIGGAAVTMAQLAGLVGNVTPKQVQALFAELETAKVFSRDNDGTIFSRRIRRDIEKAERDKANGKSGGNPRLKPKSNGSVNPLDKTVDKAQKLEARSQKLEEIDRGFAEFWKVYPRQTDHDIAQERFRELVEGGVATIQELVAGARWYRAQEKNTEPKFIKKACNWLDAGNWRDGQTSASVASSDKTVVSRDDPRWSSLSERYRQSRRVYPPADQASWLFPNEWIADLHEGVS